MNYHFCIISVLTTLSQYKGTSLHHALLAWQLAEVTSVQRVGVAETDPADHLFHVTAPR